MSPTEESLLNLTSQLLTSIAERDWETYSQLCDPSLTCFEPEARGQLVRGMSFHQFYFDLPGAGAKQNTTLASAEVRMLGNDAALVTYVRLVQKVDGEGKPATAAFEETRAWQRLAGEWKHVHFHRSALP